MNSIIRFLWIVNIFANERTGSFGEWLAKTFAKTIPGALVLHDVLIDGAEAVNKSYPEFFEDYKKLGGICHVL